MSVNIDKDKSVFFMSDDLRGRLNESTIVRQGTSSPQKKGNEIFYECSIAFNDDVVDCDLVGIQIGKSVEKISVSMTENLSSFIRRDKIQSISIYDRSAVLVKDFEFNYKDYSVTIERDNDGLRYVVSLIFT
jgi:hypothetical protein